MYEPVPGGEFDLEASALFTAIGEEPDPSILPPGSGIEISSWAGIVAHPRTLQTGRVGVFAGGDVVTGPRSVIEAVANGRRAAASIHGYLSESIRPEAELLAAVRITAEREPRLALDLARTLRARPGHVALDDPTQARPGLEPAAALAEATRCLRCDAIYDCQHIQLVEPGRPAVARDRSSQVVGVQGGYA